MSTSTSTSTKRVARRPSTPAGALKVGDRVMWGGRATTITRTVNLSPTKVRLTNDFDEVLDVDAGGPMIRLPALRLRVA